MPIFEFGSGGLAAAESTSFEGERLQERRDIQSALRERIDAIDSNLMVLAEEFSDWQDSSRRIDLLCLDANANLVVVELKRTEDGGHMELQAIRYAAMVSSMNFDQAVDTLARWRNRGEPDTDQARLDVLSFLGWDEPDEDSFAQETRIVLVAADFGKELTTSVMWLRDRGVDVRCVRLKPYRLSDGRVLLDIQQLIPLPEAADFQTKLGVKKLAERKNRAERHELRFRFWQSILGRARESTDLHANRSPGDGNWISGATGRAGFDLSYVTRQRDSQVELWIHNDKEAFRQLSADREAIETEFGAPLEWMDVEGKGARVRFVVDGGYRSPEEEWPRIHEELIDAMIRLDRAMRRRVHAIRP